MIEASKEKLFINHLLIFSYSLLYSHNMSKNLVIVESPAKAKTIEKYLGSDFVVKSSMGHIRSLPSKNGSGNQ